MKRYEKMEKSEIMEFWVGCSSRKCLECPAHDRRYPVDPAWNCAANYLNQNIKMAPRWQTAKTQEDFDKLFDGFKNVCKGTYCEDCKYYDIWHQTGNSMKDCYHAYLSELVEVQE